MEETTTYKIAEVISKTNRLFHFDISNNGFKINDFEIISKALDDNHTIYGFHNEGNYGITDEKMFLVEVEIPLKY